MIAQAGGANEEGRGMPGLFEGQELWDDIDDRLEGNRPEDVVAQGNAARPAENNAQGEDDDEDDDDDDDDEGEADVAVSLRVFPLYLDRANRLIKPLPVRIMRNVLQRLWGGPAPAESSSDEEEHLHANANDVD